MFSTQAGVVHWPVSGGHKVLLDIDDVDRVSQYKWTANKSRRGTWLRVARLLYCGRVGDKERRKWLPLGNFLLGVEGLVDHINRDPLDFRKCNLRPADRTLNNWNRRKAANTLHQYKGVQWRPRDKRWCAKIHVNKKDKHLGTFTNIEEAARAYDEAARRYYGPFACTNHDLGLLA